MIPFGVAFWANVERKGEDDCWEWGAGRSSAGYGIFRFGGKIAGSAHRLSWQETNGPIPQGMHVLHRCDNPPCVNPPCVNPAHLFLGTHADNMRDMALKNRAANGDRHWTKTHPERVCRGESHGLRLHPERVARGDASGARTHPESTPRGNNHWNARLCEADIDAIRRLVLVRSQRDVAKEFGVAQSMVSRIVNRVRWSHV